MPKFIGNQIAGATQIHDNAGETPERVRLKYSQAKLLPPEQVIRSYDTTDRGSKNSLAKRWYRWFAKPGDILGCAKCTPKMREKAASHTAWKF